MEIAERFSNWTTLTRGIGLRLIQFNDDDRTRVYRSLCDFEELQNMINYRLQLEQRFIRIASNPTEVRF